MSYSGQPETEVPAHSQLQTNVHSSNPKSEYSKHDTCQPIDEVINKAGTEPIQVFAVDKKVLEGAALGLPKEATVWDVYNNEAKKADDELVKDWRENLSSLLLFAAIFGAVLTPFIIESKKMLEQDQNELLVNVTIFGINTRGDASNPQFVPPAFVPTDAAIIINCLLFTSLGTSLVAALAAVVSLQWVADYDAAITRGGSSPEDHAKRRQFRQSGVLKWKMGEIIASLPLLLYSSVAFFWAGAIQWMWMLNPIVGYIVAGGTFIAVLFYSSTTLLAAIDASAPFKTPLSRAIYWVYQRTICLVHEVLYSALGGKLPSLGQTTRLSVESAAVVAVNLISFIILLPILIPLLAIAKIASWLDDHGYLGINKHHLPLWEPSTGPTKNTFKNAVKKVLFWAKSYPVQVTSRQREDRAAAHDRSLTQQALAWLADQITSSTNSSRRLRILTSEVVKQSPKSQLPNSPINARYSAVATSGSFSDTFWLKMFDHLSWHYLPKILSGTLSEDDRQAVGVLLRGSRDPDVWDQIFKANIYDGGIIKPTQWNRYAIDITNVTKSRGMKDGSTAALLAQEVPIPSAGSDDELQLTTRLIKWRYSGVCDTWYPRSHNYSPKYLQAYMEYLKTFLHSAHPEHYDLKGFIPLWSLYEDEGVRRETLLGLLEYFDSLVAESRFGERHSFLVGIALKDIFISYECWPSPKVPSDLSDRLAKIQDPSLALLGNIAFGGPTHFGLVPLSRFINSYSAFIDLPFQNLSSSDSPALWRLRALLWSEAPKSQKYICSMALKNPEYMSHLERIFEHPMHCLDHSCGPQHLLYHLCMGSRRLARFPKQTALFGEGSFNEQWVYIILAFLALPEDQPFSNIISLNEIPPECIERIGAMCQVLKGEPTSMLALLTDISKSPGFDCYYATNVAAMLEATEHTLSITNQGFPSHLLRPLAYELRSLNEIMKDRNRRVNVTKDQRELVNAQADRICWILETRGSA